MIEEWKDITGYEGHYQVSNLGRVKSIKRVTIRNNKTELSVKERILKQANRGSGYFGVDLHKCGLRKSVTIHRLVATAFIKKEDETFEVNHKDENKLNNRADNLEWISQIDNLRYGTGILRAAISRSKPTIQMDLDSNVIKVWNSVADVERTLGFDDGYIGRVCSGKYKTAYGFRWEFYKHE